MVTYHRIQDSDPGVGNSNSDALGFAIILSADDCSYWGLGVFKHITHHLGEYVLYWIGYGRRRVEKGNQVYNGLFQFVRRSYLCEGHKPASLLMLLNRSSRVNAEPVK